MQSDKPTLPVKGLYFPAGQGSGSPREESQ